MIAAKLPLLLLIIAVLAIIAVRGVDVLNGMGVTA